MNNAFEVSDLRCNNASALRLDGSVSLEYLWRTHELLVDRSIEYDLMQLPPICACQRHATESGMAYLSIQPWKVYTLLMSF